MLDSLDYPESDGKPIAEGDVFFDWLVALIDTLKCHFKAQENVYVSGNLLLYYRQGDVAARVAPDVFVVKGVGKHRRRTYKLWEEGQPPCLVIEVTSLETQEEDQITKRQVYAQIGVPLYVLFDPLGEYLNPPLQGFRLVQGTYQPVSLSGDGCLPCPELGLWLCLESTPRHQHEIRLYDEASARRLYSTPERTERLDQMSALLRYATARLWQASEAQRRTKAWVDQARAAERQVEEIKRALGLP